MPGATARAVWKAVESVRASSASHAAGDVSSSGASCSSPPVWTIPALQTSTSTAPASAASRSACAGSVRSATWPVPPSAAARVVDAVRRRRDRDLHPRRRERPRAGEADAVLGARAGDQRPHFSAAGQAIR